MKKNTKEDVQIWTAVGVVISGIIMCFWGFLTPPMGQVHDSVLWFLGQCFIFGGGIFGVTVYTRTQIEDIKNKINKEDKE